jgi:hypothetical protein
MLAKPETPSLQCCPSKTGVYPSLMITVQVIKPSPFREPDLAALDADVEDGRRLDDGCVKAKLHSMQAL